MRFELRASEPSIISTVASQGGAVEQMRIESGTLWMTIHLPPTVAARRVMNGIRETYPAARLVGRRQLTRSDDTRTEIHRTLTEELTDRRRSALETAVYAGFFEQPRTVSGTDIADSLGIASPTFHQHLRAAQRKLFDSILLSTSRSP